MPPTLAEALEALQKSLTDNIMLTEHLLHAKHYDKHFTDIISFNGLAIYKRFILNIASFSLRKLSFKIAQTQ